MPKRKELDRVKLARPVEIDYDPDRDGFDTTHRFIPKDSFGTIVHVLPGNDAYDVEFTMPFPALARVREEEIV
jgi:hypothetical protein